MNESHPLSSAHALGTLRGRPAPAGVRLGPRLAVGQLVQATVVRAASRAEHPGAGGARAVQIAFEGQHMVARTRLDLQPGERLALRVERISPQPLLAVLDRTTAPASSAGSAVAAALRASLPRQRPLAETLEAMFAGAPTRAGTQLPASAVDSRIASAFERLRRSVPSRGELTDPGTLRARVEGSGVLLEARLAGLGNPAGSNPAGLGDDLKGALNALRAQAAPASASEAAERPARPLLELVDAALARLRVLQAGTLRAREDLGGAVRLDTELPVLGPNGILEGLELRIERRSEGPPPGRPDASEADPAAWRVTLHLSLPELGTLAVHVAVRERSISARFVTDEVRGAAAIEPHLAELAERLRAAGLSIDDLRCEHGPGSPLPGPMPARPLVHVII